MTPHEKALLDVIAFAEGTLGVSNNGYDVTFNFYRIEGWTENTNIVHGGNAWKKITGGTGAAGRYQFLYGTWTGRQAIAGKGNNAPMTKDNQDELALRLIKDKRIPENIVDSRSVSIEEIHDFDKFKIMLNKLAPEWASLPVTISVVGHKGVRLSPGQSYYEGSTINKSDDSPEELYDLFMKALNIYQNQ